MADLRTQDGRFISPHCTDPNCDGSLVRDVEDAYLGGPSQPILRCDGLTHVDDDSPLIACSIAYPALAPSGSNHVR
jgi:hypothetical protein